MSPKLSECTNVRYLDLSGNALDSIPSAVVLMGKLEELHAHGNQITGLPKGFSGLFKLKTLVLHHNAIGRPSPGDKETALEEQARARKNAEHEARDAHEARLI